MPVRPCQRIRYPRDWKVISLEVRERAGWACEGSPGFYPDCRAAHGEPHPVTQSRVVLTVAHLDHQPENNGEPGDRPNLMAMCQRCHLTYDAKHHAMNAAITRAAKASQPDMFEHRDVVPLGQREGPEPSPSPVGSPPPPRHRRALTPAPCPAPAKAPRG